MQSTAVQCRWTDLGRDRSGWPLQRSPGRSKPSSSSLPHSGHPGRQRCPCQHYAPHSIHTTIVWLVIHRVQDGWSLPVHVARWGVAGNSFPPVCWWRQVLGGLACQHHTLHSICPPSDWLVNHHVQEAVPSQGPWQGVPCSRQRCPTRILCGGKWKVAHQGRGPWQGLPCSRRERSERSERSEPTPPIPIGLFRSPSLARSECQRSRSECPAIGNDRNVFRSGKSPEIAVPH